jgi:hypothetical protein
MSCGIKHVKRPYQRKLLPDRNICEKVPDQMKNDINRRELKVTRSVGEKETMVKQSNETNRRRT